MQLQFVWGSQHITKVEKIEKIGVCVKDKTLELDSNTGFKHEKEKKKPIFLHHVSYCSYIGDLHFTYIVIAFTPVPQLPHTCAIRIVCLFQKLILSFFLVFLCYILKIKISTLDTWLMQPTKQSISTFGLSSHGLFHSSPLKCREIWNLIFRGVLVWVWCQSW